jgi:WD40 repeat protein
MLIKAFRLFVSSTFADFAEEREVLQNKVFPALDTYCAANGFQFHPIDLRWGVNEEAQLNQRAAEICLSEVRAAKGYPPPNFLIMIGNRYGWVPLPFAIARDEFDALVAWLDKHDQKDAVCALGTVYQHDDNHLVPRGITEADRSELLSAYTLRSRADELPELKPVEAWANKESELRRALQQAADDLLKHGRIDRAAHEKYFVSLTEQEIIHGLAGHRGIDGDLLPASSADAPEAIVFIREIAGGVGNARVNSFYMEQEPRLDDLKERIRRSLSAESIVTANAAFDEGGSLTEKYLSDFAGQIEGKLKAAVDKHVARVDAIERAPNFALESERSIHDAFARGRQKIFVGREGNLSAIRRYLADTSDHPLVLHGRSGFGKSALMARAISAAEEGGSTPVVARFIGASAASSDLRSLLISVIDDLATHGIVAKPDEFQHDPIKFHNQVRALLSSVAKPTIIILDALDQLQLPQDLGWLPDKLPSALKLVLSVLDDPDFESDSAYYRSLRERLTPDAFLEIEPLAPAHAREIVSALEQQSLHRLQDGQRNYIIGQFEKAGVSPLYLRTAFEVARSWKSAAVAGQNRHVLAESTGGVIAQYIAELSTVRHHEPELVTRTLGYLAAAKNGLSAKELAEVLSRDAGAMSAVSSDQYGARTAKLPPSVWVRLNRDLAPFLVEKLIDNQPLMQFFHRQVVQVVHAQHYEHRKLELHAALTAYFESQTTQQDDRCTYQTRCLSELPFQLHQAENASRLDEILMSPDWMQQKLAAFGPRPLIEDYQYARTNAHTLAGQTLELVAGTLARDHRQLLPQLYGRLATCTDPAVQAFRSEARRHLPRPSLLTRMSSLTPPGAEITRLEGHTDPIRALAVLPDGRLASGSWDYTIRLWDPLTGAETARLDGQTSRDLKGQTWGDNVLVVMPDGRVASGSVEGHIRLWDLRSGAETARLEGHTSGVNALAVLANGRLASGSQDQTIRLWDPLTGAETACLRGHTGSVNALAVLPDGRLASGSGKYRVSVRVDDTSIRLWDLNTSAEVARLDGHSDPVTALAVLHDGRLASGSHDDTIRLWDSKTGTETVRLEGHTDAVTALAVLPDGRLASGSNDNTIRLWDTTKGTETGQLLGLGHADRVTTLAVLSDGRLASGSDDCTIRLWDPRRGAESARLEGSTGRVNALAVLHDGRLASGAGSDITLKDALRLRDTPIRLWDPNAGTETARLEGHTEKINALAVLPDGRLASGSHDRTIRLWDPKTGTEISQLGEGYYDAIMVLAVLRDGRLASGSLHDHTIWLWDAETGAALARLEGHTDRVNALAVLHDGRLASGSDDRTIRLWDPLTGAETACLQGHTDSVNALAVLPDGQLASGSGDISIIEFTDPTIRLWDPNTGTETRQLKGHIGGVKTLTALPDGRLASGSDDKTIRVWDPRTGMEITRLEVDAAVLRLVPLPNGGLVAGDQMGRLHWLEVFEGPDIQPSPQIFKSGSGGASALPSVVKAGADKGLPASTEPAIVSRARSAPDEKSRFSAFQRLLRKLLPGG